MRRENAELSRCGTEKTPEETGDRIQESGVREYGILEDGISVFKSNSMGKKNRDKAGRSDGLRTRIRLSRSFIVSIIHYSIY